MFNFIYYTAIFYCSIFVLNVMDKISKGEIKNNNEFKSFILSKCFVVMSNFYRIKRISTEFYQGLKNGGVGDGTDSDASDDSDDGGSDGKYKFKMQFLSDKGIYYEKVTIRKNKIMTNDKVAEYIDMRMFVEFENNFKEISKADFLDNNVADIIKFLNKELIINDQLFLNI
jgi:hypothetical protein